MTTFKEYFQETKGKEISRGRTAGLRAAKACMNEAFEAARAIILDYGVCKIKVLEDSAAPENIGVSFSAPAKATESSISESVIYASSCPEYQEWLDLKPGKHEMDAFRKAFLESISKNFEVDFGENGEALLSLDQL